jgi:hypothetical protein
MIKNFENFGLGSGLESFQNEGSDLDLLRRPSQRLGQHLPPTLDLSLALNSPLDIRLGNDYLIQSFVLEQMPLFQRYCLSKEFFQFDEVSSDLIHPLARLGSGPGASSWAVWPSIYTGSSSGRLVAQVKARDKARKEIQKAISKPGLGTSSSGLFKIFVCASGSSEGYETSAQCHQHQSQ